MDNKSVSLRVKPSTRDKFCHRSRRKLYTDDAAEDSEFAKPNFQPRGRGKFTRPNHQPRGRAKFTRPNHQPRGRTSFSCTSNISEEKVRFTLDNKSLQKNVFDNFECLAKCPVEEMISCLVHNSSFFKLIEKGQLSTENVIKTVELLKLSLSSVLNQSLSNLISKIITKNFLSALLKLLSSKEFEEQENCRSVLQNILDVLDRYMSVRPTEAVERIKELVDYCTLICKNTTAFSEKLGVCEELLEQIKSYEKKYIKCEKQITDLEHKCHEFEDFFEMPILPTPDDINLLAKPTVRKNLVVGKYNDEKHYLDVQFKLLREDFMRPLRKGIQKYRDGSTKKNYDVNIYNKVKVVSSKLNDSKLIYNVKLNYAFKDKDSSRFMFGNLLCFTKNNFKTFILGEVFCRDDLLKGIIGVCFYDVVPDYDEYTVAESKVYFRTYKCVLEVLQKLFRKSLPLKEYILYVTKECIPPTYVKLETIFNLDLFNNNLETRVMAPLTEWPSYDELALDQAQLRALHTALNNKMAVIQGPPGTGKTYLGIIIMKILLNNIHHWQKEKNPSPILVVCYTNHALDQFLEGISNFTKSIIRIGGRCKNENVQKFSLKDKMRSLRHCRSHVKTVLQREHLAASSKNKLIQNKIQAIRHAIKEIYYVKGIISLDTFEHYQVLPKCIDDYFCLKSWLVDHFSDIEELQSEPILRAKQHPSENIDDDDIYAITLPYLNKMINEQEKFIVNNDGNKDTVQFYADKNHYEHLRNIIEKGLKMHLSGIVIDGFVEEIIMNLKHDDRWALYNSWHHSVLNIFQADYNSLETITEDTVECILSKLEKNEGILRKTFLDHFITLPEFDLVKWLLPTYSEDVDQSFVENLRLKEECDRYCEELDLDLNIPVSSICNREILHYIIKSDDIYRKYYELHNAFQNLQLHDMQKLELYIEMNSCEHNFKTIEAGLSLGDHPVDDDVSLEYLMTLSTNERWKVYNYWKEKLKLEMYDNLKKLILEWEENSKLLSELNIRDQVSVLRNNLVVGMTTTGAAIHNVLIEVLKPVIVMVEEAAEILEAHTFTSLPSSCEHLIMIGDHLQLRPSTSDYQLAKTYGLEISLFERMIKNEMKYETLENQHRMKPEISKLLIPTFYPNLKNHESVFNYSNVAGVVKSVFFLTHDKYEDFQHSQQSASHQNEHEAQFVLGLAQHLLYQDYKSSQITILTPYKGQFFLLKKLQANSSLSEVEINVVDNFQGEENDIIILSLVRSNKEENVGFLKIPNRICVALSRAKKGFFLVGNMHQLAKSGNVWNEIEKSLLEMEAIDNVLPLKCETHGTIINVQTGKDFELKSPNGGCCKMCDENLPYCIHKCKMRCHPYDKEHQKYVCEEICSRVCHSGHPCSKKCYQDCFCEVPVDLTLNCGHVSKVKCQFYFEHLQDKVQDVSSNVTLFRKNNNSSSKFMNKHSHADLCKVTFDSFHIGYNCKNSCLRGAVDGCPEKHLCEKMCYEECEPCIKIVKKTALCGHENEVKCSDKENDIKCSFKCEKTLECMHKCSRKCFEKCEPCNEIVQKTALCGHVHKVKCSDNENDIKCSFKCEKTLECMHKCSRKCFEKCKPCNEILQKTALCGHEHKIKCSENENYIMCSFKCEKTLECMHKCSRKCFEKCKPCNEIVQKTALCGHEHKIKCSENENYIMCSFKCEKTLECMHKCLRKCFEKCEPCNKLVATKINCSQGHYQEVLLPCYTISRKIDSVKYSLECNALCEQVLKCGHICTGKCGSCFNGKLHVSCKQPCEKILLCGHKCNSQCGKECLCELKINIKCSHKNLKVECGIAIDKCNKPCLTKCSHKKCPNKCSEDCPIDLCLKDCETIKKCEHKCSGLCGELCPKSCLHCLNIPKENRMITLEDCKHEMTSSELDLLFKNRPTEIGMKLCPQCAKPIYNNQRFKDKLASQYADIVKTLQLVRQKTQNLNSASIVSSTKLEDCLSVFALKIAQVEVPKKMRGYRLSKLPLKKAQVEESKNIRGYHHLLKKQLLFFQWSVLSITNELVRIIKRPDHSIVKFLSRLVSMKYLPSLEDRCSMHFWIVQKYFETFAETNKNAFVDCKEMLNSFLTSKNTLDIKFSKELLNHIGCLSMMQKRLLSDYYVIGFSLRKELWHKCLNCQNIIFFIKQYFNSNEKVFCFKCKCKFSI